MPIFNSKSSTPGPWSLHALSGPHVYEVRATDGTVIAKLPPACDNPNTRGDAELITSAPALQLLASAIASQTHFWAADDAPDAIKRINALVNGWIDTARELVDDKTILESYGFKLVTRAEFDAATDVPEGLREYRAEQLAKPGAFVVYDPDDNEEGWLLIGDDTAALASETVAERCSP